MDFLPDYFFFYLFGQPESAPLDRRSDVFLVEHRAVHFFAVSAAGQFVLADGGMHGLDHHTDKQALEILGNLLRLLALFIAEPGRTGSHPLQLAGFFGCSISD